MMATTWVMMRSFPDGLDMDGELGPASSTSNAGVGRTQGVGTAGRLLRLK
jgi:hypothetical protein